MLYFILIWTVLLLGCSVVGLGILNLFSHAILSRVGDRIVLSLWLGLMTLAITLMIVAFFLPLSLSIGTGIVAGLTVGTIWTRKNRDELQKLYGHPGLWTVAGMFAVEISVAQLINRPMVWFDSGFYHLGMLRWLNQFGAVPGVALINGSFGFSSAWFPFSAPFVSELFGNQIGAVSNGFIFLLAILSALIFGQQAWQHTGRLTDYFGLCFFSLTAIAYGMTVFTGSPILISFSADLAITFMVGMMGWLFLLLQSQHPPPSTPLALFNADLLVLIFAAAALSFKLTAIPLVAIALVFYSGHHGRLLIQRFCRGLVILSAMIAPVLIFGLITAGCPLYPSQLMCLDLPWTLSATQSAKALQPIAVLKGENRLPNLLDIQDWIWLITKRVQLFIISPEARGMVALSVLFMVVFGVLLLRLKRQPQKQGEIWVVVLGLLGSLFILSTSPLIRFGFGYFTVIPALILAIGLMHYKGILLERWEPIADTARWPYLSPFLFGFSGLLLLHAWTQSQLLQPPAIPSTQLTSAQINDVSYRYPTDYQLTCWNAALPCTPLPLEDNIALRNPKMGITGGFRRLETQEEK